MRRIHDLLSPDLEGFRQELALRPAKFAGHDLIATVRDYVARRGSQPAR